MATNTPRSLAPSGIGSGRAQVFGTPGDAFGMKQKLDAERKADERYDAEVNRVAKKTRDAAISEALDIGDPTFAWEPLDQQLISDFDVTRTYVRDYIAKGGDVTDVDFQTNRAKMLTDSLALSKKVGAIKERVDGLRTQVSESPYYDAETMSGFINDIYLNPDGTSKKISDIDTRDIDNLLMEHPEAFNLNTFTNDFVGNMKDNVYQYTFDEMAKSGKHRSIEDVEVMLNDTLYVPDPDQADGRKRDANGNVIINLTPEFKDAFLASAAAKGAVEHMMDKTGASQDEVIRTLIGNKGTAKKTSTNKQVSLSEPASIEKDLKLQTRGTERAKNINAIVNAFSGDDGYFLTEPSPEAKAAIGQLATNTKINGEPVAGNLLVGPSDNPTDILGEPFDDPYPGQPKLVFRVQTGQKPGGRARYALETIPLGTQGTAEKLAGILETAEATGNERISFDFMKGLLNDDSKSYFNLRESVSREITDRPVEDINTRMADLIKNENFSEHLMDAVDIDGKKVIGVEKERSWGTMTGYEVTYENGEVESISRKTPEGKKRLRELLSNMKIDNSKPKPAPKPPKQKPVPGDSSKIDLGIDWGN